MFKPFTLFIASRYLRAKSRNHFISFISLVSILGIALGVMALITVLSVMNGFETEIKLRILSMTPHVTVTGWQNQPLIKWQHLNDDLKKNPAIEGLSPYVEGQAMVQDKGAVSGISLKGISPALIDSVFPLSSHLIAGSLDALQPGSYKVIIGEGLAKRFDLAVGDKITFFAPQAEYTPMGVTPRMKRFEVGGIFSVGYVYDSFLAFSAIDDAARFYHLPQGAVSGFQLKLKSYLAAPRVAFELRKRGAGEYYATSWTEQNANYFSAVKMEKTLMFLILTLIVAVAAFNLVSTLVMCVTDKQSDIAILRTMGATPRKIIQIFMLQGSISGVLGTLAGMFGGILLALNVTQLVEMVQNLFAVEFLSKDVYFISFLPSQLLWSDVVQVSLLSLGLSFLATIYPAWQAAKIMPAEALRYE